MHQSSRDAMERALHEYVIHHLITAEGESSVHVADIGSFDVNGTYRDLFDQKTFRYTGLDLEPGPNVDIVMPSPATIPLESGSQQLVVSGQMLEHAPRFWEIFQDMARILAPGGRMIIIAPSAGPEHRFPVDCYRYLPDSFRALASDNKLTEISIRVNNWGPWYDLVGVFEKPRQLSGTVTSAGTEQSAADIGLKGRKSICGENSDWNPDPKETNEPLENQLTRERLILERIMRKYKPGLALEIAPSALLSCSSSSRQLVVVESSTGALEKLSRHATINREIPADYYFENNHDSSIPIDFAVIHPRKSVATLVRDFVNIEENATRSAAIFIPQLGPEKNVTDEDTSPDNSRIEIAREFTSFLISHRPDLKIQERTRGPLKGVLVRGLDPRSRWLRQNYSDLF